MKYSKKFLMLLLLLATRTSIACPLGAPDGFEASPKTSERAYHDRDKRIQIVVKCEPKSKAAEIMKGLPTLGDVNEVDKTISFVDVKKGTLRIYISTEPDLTQIAVVAKSSDDLEKVAPKLLAYLKKH